MSFETQARVRLSAALIATAVALGLAAVPASAQSQQEATDEADEGIASDRRTPLLSTPQDRQRVRVPVSCGDGVRKDVELQPADAQVTFSFNCLCSEDENAIKQAMIRYRDDYMRVYRNEISLDEMGTAADYFADIALPFADDGSGGTELTLALDPGEKEEKTLHCYTAADFKIIDDWARYIIFGN